MFTVFSVLFSILHVACLERRETVSMNTEKHEQIGYRLNERIFHTLL